jgi:hypothetical protein
MAASLTATVTQRFPDGGHANWNYFPAPYVMPPEQQRNSSSLSRNRRNLGQNLSHSYETPPIHWQQEPFQRPATAISAISHESPDAIRRTRSRTKLQKRPSQRVVRKAASASTMSRPFSPSQGPFQDQADITALPQVPDDDPTERRTSLRKRPSTGIGDRPRSQQGLLEQSSTKPTTHGLLPIRNKTSSSDKFTPIDSRVARSPSPGRVPSPTIPPRTPRYQELAPFDPSPLNPRYHIPTSSFANGRTEPTPPTSELSESALSPPPVKHRKTEHRQVETPTIPEITPEDAGHSKTDTVQEEIIREIHVHHFFEYNQPIKTIEIVTARHFIVDAQTGEKVEIPPPEGWVMANLPQPHFSDPTGPPTRQYVLDTMPTSGMTEPPARQNGKKLALQPELRKKTSIGGSWTPFPKVR